MINIIPPEIASKAVRCWTNFDRSKSVDVCIKIYACNEIILDDCVKEWKKLGTYIAYTMKLRFDKRLIIKIRKFVSWMHDIWFDLNNACEARSLERKWHRAF